MSQVEYQRNNIIFRIASANAISKFKSAQAQTFIQLSRKELDFDEASREVVLLEYDRFSQCLLKIEHICLSAKNNLSKENRQAIIGLYKDELSVIEDVMHRHPKMFSSAILEFVKMIHTYSIHIAYAKIGVGVEMDIHPSLAFVNFTLLLTEYLDHMLVSLHEFSNNTIKKVQAPFICVANFSLEGETKFKITENHAAFFKSAADISEFIIKNYSTSNIFADLKTYMAPKDFSVLPEERTSKTL